MAIKNILLHMGVDTSRLSRLHVALGLAQRYRAHLEVAFMITPAGMPAAIQGRGASAAYIAEATAIAREKAEEVHAEIAAGCAGTGIDWTWEILEGDHNRLLAERSHYADLLVVTQHHGVGGDDDVLLHRPGDLLLTASCPLLGLPKDVDLPSVGSRVLIAWKDSREAARAVRDALPFLERADSVHVLVCTTDDDGSGQDREIATYLRRHGIAVAPPTVTTADGPVGEVILNHAGALQADLLVMGAYGHSRWREIVLGGVTQHVLRHMTVPVLASH